MQLVFLILQRQFEILGSSEMKIDNVVIYDRLLRATQCSDLLDVSRTLRWASRDRNLRAFQRCVQRG